MGSEDRENRDRHPFLEQAGRERPGANTRRNRCSSLRAECWLVFATALALYAAVGVYVTLALDKVDWGSVATTSRAFDVAFGGERPALSRIGFAEPPLPALIQIPLVAAVPASGTHGLAGPITSGLLAALACVVLCKLMAETGAARWLRWLLLLAFGLNPTWLYSAATGSSAPLVCFLVLACGLYVARWAQEGLLRDLVMCGLVAGAALMAHFAAASLTIAVALAVGLIVWSDRDGGWSEVEGTLITLLLPPLAVAVVWAGTCWAIMGDPLYSLRATPLGDWAWLLALELGLFASLLLWCRSAAGSARPLLAGLVPALIAATAGLVIAGWDGAAPSPLAGYAYAQRASEEPDTFILVRHVAAAAAEATGDGLAIVDSDMAFAVSLASGRPRLFIALDAAQRNGVRNELSRATHLLSDRVWATDAPERLPRDVARLVGDRRLKKAWTTGKWRLFRLVPNVE